jgi:hypothetical protein
MPMIKLTYSGVADFMASTPSKQRKILTEYKYPDEDESRAKIFYYREARESIVAYHKGKKSNSWLEQQGTRLGEMAALEDRNSARRSRLQNNSRTILDYSRNYNSDSCQILDQFSQKLLIGGVVISVYPELHVTERNREKMIKLDFGKNAHNDDYNRISCQLLLMAATEAGFDLPSSSFGVRHIATKSDIRKGRVGARLEKDIEATCNNIAAIWDTL